MALDLSFLDAPVGLPYQEEVFTDNLLNDTVFPIPTVEKPELFLQNAFESKKEPSNPAIRFNKGTTTLAFIYEGGIVVAVDSRATQGPYIASQSVQKVIEINPWLLGTMAGGAADCAFWERELGRRTRLFELTNKERMTVAAASKTLANILYYYRGYGLSVGSMISGWDKRGPSIFYVDSDGTRIKGDRFCVGSGGTYAYGVLDTGYRKDLTFEEACELGRRSIFHATHRDAYSGGIINVYHIDKHGWKKISSQDSNDLYWQRYSPEKKEPAPL